jgi:zona occludens toxin
MPLKAYVGLPRSGKSYEVVKNVILPALRQGRRVVSNIAGLNFEAFQSLLYSEGLTDDQIGQLVQVDHEQVKDAYFFRTDEDEQNGVISFIQAGDLVALDEIWRFWKKRGEITEKSPNDREYEKWLAWSRAMNFFRMHGHMTHAKTGLTCEIALITQSIRDINENIRDVVQETYQAVKNTKVGSDKSYIVNVFQRGSTSKPDFIRTLAPRFYDSDYFPLYKSHSQHKEGEADAVESNPDDRGNLLKGALFKFGLPLGLISIIAGGFLLYRMFHKPPPSPLPTDSPAVLAASSSMPAPSLSRVGGSPSLESWRVVGFFIRSGMVTFIVVNSEGSSRELVNPPNYQFIGSGASVQLPEGGYATTWQTFNKQSRGVF